MLISGVPGQSQNLSLTTKQKVELPLQLANDGSMPAAAKPDTTRAVAGVKEQQAQDKAKSNSERPVSPSELADAIKKLNDTVKLYKGDLQFTVDEDTHLQIVKVVDRGSKELIRQIPSPEAVRIARAIDDFSSILLRDKA